MPRKIRTNKRRAAISDNEIAWLRGEKSGFFRFKHKDELEALWESCGDDSKMFYRRGMACPITLEKLEGFEDEWLNSGDGDADKYGGASFFIDQYFNDAEKQALWAKRGDKNLYRWSQGMRRPENK